MIEADLHIHSRHSFDSLLSPRTIIKTALKKGLSAIAVADHNTVKGALETIREAASTRLLVIPAIEVETNAGHILGLFVENDFKTREIDEVIDEIRNQGGITVLLHPARIRGSRTKKVVDKVDVIEALNGRTCHSGNLKAKDLALRFNKPMIAGSDAHLRFEIGCVRTIVECDPSTLEDVKKHIINGKRVLVGRESFCFVHVFSFGIQIFKYALRRI
ncbi:PHP domain-containing protein [Candidatus Bathyarchaeota archaeon]|nr:MAG: PHP domain-containing protein [Candidatus Bathyarchaeota archaeon]